MNRTHFQNKRKISLVLIAILFILSVSYSISIRCFAQEDFSQFNLREGNNLYISPTPGEIPIVALDPTITPANPSIADFETVSECGYNMVRYYSSIPVLKSACGIAYKTGIRVLAYNDKFKTANGDSLLKELEGIPGFAGLYYCDEPKFNNLNNLASNYNNLTKEVPNKLAIVNLVGGLNSTYTGPCRNFSSYLDTIQRLFKPAVWSFDIYPIRKNKDKLRINGERFYATLECFSKVSKLTDRPFWSFCQTMAFDNKSGNGCPPATVAYLRYANFSSLAYGAQGILYWTYSQRKSNKNETYLSALVNLDGTRTAAWYAAQQVNREIRLFTPVFLNSDVAEVCHSGSKRYRGTTPLKGEFGPIAKVSSEVVEREGDMAGGDDGFMFSHLKTGGKDYVVVVSHNPLAPQKLSLVFKPGSRPVLMEPVKTKSGMKLREKRLRGTWQTEVEPGGYLVLRY